MITVSTSSLEYSYRRTSGNIINSSSCKFQRATLSKGPVGLRGKQPSFLRFDSSLVNPVDDTGRNARLRKEEAKKGMEKNGAPRCIGQHGGLVTATISLWQKGPVDNDGLVPPHNAPYTRQFMRWNVLNTSLPSLAMSVICGGCSHHVHYISRVIF